MSSVYQGIYDTLSDLLIRAYDIRKEYAVTTEFSETLDTPVELYDKLKLCRNGLDRLEVILNDAIRLKARVDRLKIAKQGEVEDAEVKVVSTNSKAKDYQAAVDRKIEVNAKTISERRALRQVTEVSVEAQATVEVIRNMHRGLDAHRNGLNSGLRAITVISSLER